MPVSHFTLRATLAVGLDLFEYRQSDPTFLAWHLFILVQKIRPGIKWNPNSTPADIFTAREKLNLIPRLLSKYGIGPTLELIRSQKRLLRYQTDGYIGYALIVSAKK